MYNFSSVDDLVYNKTKLKNILDETTYGRLTIDNQDRDNSPYNTFGNNKTEVILRDYGDTFVEYSVNNVNVDPRNIFMFSYTEENGKIIFVQEYELTLVK